MTRTVVRFLWDVPRQVPLVGCHHEELVSVLPGKASAMANRLRMRATASEAARHTLTRFLLPPLGLSPFLSLPPPPPPLRKVLITSNEDERFLIKILTRQVRRPEVGPSLVR